MPPKEKVKSNTAPIKFVVSNVESTAAAVTAVDTTNTAEVTAETRKKPGRPRKENTDNCSERNGIVQTPLNSSNVFELVYDNPILFKKIFALFKAADINDLTIIFSREYMRILVKDEESGNLICVNIRPQFMNRYYLHEKYDRIETLVKREGFEKTFRRVNKSSNEVMFFIGAEDISSIINVRISNKSSGQIKENEIEVYQRTTETIPIFPEDFEEVLNIINKDSTVALNSEENEIRRHIIDNHGPITLEKYKLQFTLFSKILKSMVDEIHNSKNSTFEISKYGRNNEPLTISSTGINKFKTSYIYSNPSIINLRSNLPDRDDNIFSISLSVDKVRQFTNNIIGDTVDIGVCCNENNNIVRFISESDKRTAITSTGRRFDGYVCQLLIYSFS